jgi:hypothetical protein
MAAPASLTGEARTHALQELSRHLIRALSEEVDAIKAEMRAPTPDAKHIHRELEHLPRPSPALRKHSLSTPGGLRTPGKLCSDKQGFVGKPNRTKP